MLKSDLDPLIKMIKLFIDLNLLKEFKSIKQQSINLRWTRWRGPYVRRPRPYHRDAPRHASSPAALIGTQEKHFWNFFTVFLDE